MFPQPKSITTAPGAPSSGRQRADLARHAAHHQPVGVDHARLQPAHRVVGLRADPARRSCRLQRRGGRRSGRSDDLGVAIGGGGPGVAAAHELVARAAASPAIGPEGRDPWPRTSGRRRPGRRPRPRRRSGTAAASASARVLSSPQTTGRPQASASCTTSGKPSPWLGSTKTSAGAIELGEAGAGEVGEDAHVGEAPRGRVDHPPAGEGEGDVRPGRRLAARTAHALLLDEAADEERDPTGEAEAEPRGRGALAPRPGGTPRCRRR